MTDKRTVDESQAEILRVMMPSDANPDGYVFGGTILKTVDETVGVVAKRHARTNIVTASIERMSFWEPVFIGDFLICKGSINYVGETSMVIGIRVEAEDPDTGERRHVGSSYATAVALNDDGKPTRVPRLELETEEQERRWERAKKAKEDMQAHMRADHED